MNLQQIERQRSRIYKNQLKQQLQRKKQMSKISSQQMIRHDRQDIEHQVQMMKRFQDEQKRQEKQMKNRVRQENIFLANNKGKIKELYDSKNYQLGGMNNSSFLESIADHQKDRYSAQKEIHKKMTQQNLNQKYVHKELYNKSKSYQLSEQQKHMERLKQLQIKRNNEYKAIREKHSLQDQKSSYQLHKKLQELNEDYKRSLQSFAYNGKDILDSLKRDDSVQIYQRKRNIQSELKHQMDEKHKKQALQRSEIYTTEDLKNSLFKNIMYKQTVDYKKPLSEYLKQQMKQSEQKRSIEKKDQKKQMVNFFGDKEGLERIKMMKYVDQNLGIESEQLRSFSPTVGRNTSPYRITNLHSPKKQAVVSQINKDSIKNNTSGSLNNDKVQNNPQNQDKIKTSPIKMRNQTSPIILSTEKINNASGTQKVKETKSFRSYDFINGKSKRYDF